VEQANSYLEFADGNLEQAMTLFYAEGTAPPEQQISGSSGGGIQGTQAQIHQSGLPRDPIAPHTQQLNAPMDEDYNPMSAMNHQTFFQNPPPRQPAAPVHDDEFMIEDDEDIMPDDVEDDEPVFNRPAPVVSRSSIPTSSRNADLKELFSLPDNLKRVNSTWEASRQMALRQKKLLLITIHDPQVYYDELTCA
jgi:hypothetical protein